MTNVTVIHRIHFVILEGVTVMIHKVKNLCPDQKVVIESLLGRCVLEDEAISVRAFESLGLSDQRRPEISEELNRYFLEVDAGREPGSSEEAEESWQRQSEALAPGTAHISEGHTGYHAIAFIPRLGRLSECAESFSKKTLDVLSRCNGIAGLLSASASTETDNPRGSGAETLHGHHTTASA